MELYDVDKINWDPEGFLTDLGGRVDREIARVEILQKHRLQRSGQKEEVCCKCS